MRLLDDIINKEVLDSQANILGKVKDVEIEASSFQPESIIISKENKSGLSGRIGNSVQESKIPFEDIGSIGDKIILKETIDDLLNP